MSCTRIRQPPSGGGPATEMSPPSPTSTPQPSATASRDGGPVRGPGLGRGAEIQVHAAGQGQQPRLLVEPDLAPAGHRPDGEPDRRAHGGQQREVTVVAEGGHRVGHGRVHVPVRHPGRAQRHRDRLREQRADLHGAGLVRCWLVRCWLVRCWLVPAVRAEPHQLGVGPEAAAGLVHRGQVGLEEAAALGQLARVGDQQPDLGAQGPPVRGRRLPGTGRRVAGGRGTGRRGAWGDITSRPR